MISLFDERITVLFQLIDGGFERNGHGCRSGVDENSGGGGGSLYIGTPGCQI